jgi:hypothetical protein
MSQYLVRNPDDLYKSYLPDTIVEYYPFDFLYEFTSIESDTFYDILNSLSDKQLASLNRYLYQQWSLLKHHKPLQEVSPTKRSTEILSRQLTPPNQETKQAYNEKYSQWIQNDKVLSLYFMNQCLTFLLPK